MRRYSYNFHPRTNPYHNEWRPSLGDYLGAALVVFVLLFGQSLLEVLVRG